MISQKIRAIAVLLSLLGLITACHGGSTSQNVPREQYVAYCTEQTTTTGPIVIRFLEEAPAIRTNIGEKELYKAVSLSPHTTYRVKVLNSRTLAIEPDYTFAAGAEYTVKVHLGDLLENPKAPSFSFAAKIQVPRFTIHSELAVDQDNTNNCIITGSVITTEAVDDDFIEKGMSFSPSGFAVSWNHDKQTNTHTFTISNITRKQKEYGVEVKTHYPSLGKGAGFYAKKHPIAALGVFTYLYGNTVTDPQQIDLFFSNNLDITKKLRDYIGITPAEDFRYTVSKNKLSLYPVKRIKGDYTVILDQAIADKEGTTLGRTIRVPLTLENIAPQVELLDTRSVLPSGNNMSIMFRAINYAKTRVRIKKIHENNILQFLQDNNLNGNNNLYAVASVLADTTLTLGQPADESLKNWGHYSIHLDKLIRQEPGAIYRVEICGVDPLGEEDEEDDWWSDYYFGNYETYHKRSCNILASDLGVIAKSNGTGYEVFVTDIITTKPKSGVKICLYDYVHQMVAEAVTNSEGRASLKGNRPGSVIIATSGKDRMYVNTDNGYALSTSNFEVGGSHVDAKVKAYIFGERGVWRPGDTIHLTVICRFMNDSVPRDYPVTVRLYDPSGRNVQSMTKSDGKDGMFYFPLTTGNDAPTGRWEALVDIGSETFTKGLKIETVKPNKLKMDFGFDRKGIISTENVDGRLHVSWLHGAVAGKLNTKTAFTLQETPTQFEKYPDYVFSDLARSYSNQEWTLFEKTTDENGDIEFHSRIPLNLNTVPGFLKANFTIRAFEPSGDFSTTTHQATLSPFDIYIGMKVNEKKTDWGSLFADAEEDLVVDLVAVNPAGESRSPASVMVQVFEMDWHWWWTSNNNELASYTYDSSKRPVFSTTVSLSNGKAKVQVDKKDLESGIYYVRAYDRNGLHATSKMLQVRHAWEDETAEDVADAKVKLNTFLDKDRYTPGETATLSIPSAMDARALITIEKQDRILHSFWVNCDSLQTKVPIRVTEDMMPNAYVSVSMLQPHHQTRNDAPIRMYGICRICADGPQSKLNPVIGSPDEIRPQAEYDFTVSEADGRAMTYCVDIVDEGLLGITNFPLPDPWRYFFAIQALGVRTWDIFNQVIGAYGGKIEQMFAIGGDNEEMGQVGGQKANRFRPVVRHLGPFSLQAGKTNSHRVKLPPYIGSVRIAVEATNGKAMGSKSKNVKVRKPVMIQATLPRTAGTQEQIEVPVTVFFMDNDIGELTVSIEGNEYFTPSGSTTATVNRKTSGEEMVYFRGTTSASEGTAKVRITAKGRKDAATDEITWNVINPNPAVTESETLVLTPGESKDISLELPGMAGTNLLHAEAAVIPSIDLNSRLRFLTAYPHECLEQLTSRVFPLLYIGSICDMNADAIARYESMVTKALHKMTAYQSPSGAMQYWAGGSYINPWGTVYAAHFMVEAENRGYAVPAALKKGVLSYLKKLLQDKDADNNTKAYALYVLALNKEPQKGMMNRMKESIAEESNTTIWMLAAAYAASGKAETAKQVMTKVNLMAKKTYNPYSPSFDSPNRDKAIALTALNAVKDREQAFKLVLELAKDLNNPGHWMSTHTTAWALSAICRFATEQPHSDCDVSLLYKGNRIAMRSNKTIVGAAIPIAVNATGKQTLTVTNNSQSDACFTLTAKGIPPRGKEKPLNNGISLAVTYKDMAGNSIDPETLAQGTEVTVVTTVTNTSQTRYTNLALTQRFPSGWEIRNERLYNPDYRCPKGVDYQDFRDDSVYSYFDLPVGGAVSIKTCITATYAGEYYLPAVSCEAMYDHTVGANNTGRMVSVYRK